MLSSSSTTTPPPLHPSTPPQTRLRDRIVVFGGAGMNGTLNDTWLISAPPLQPPLSFSDDPDAPVEDAAPVQELQWELPEVTGTPPSARAYHSSVARLNYAEDGLEQLVVFGGSGSAGRLNDVHILHLPSLHWTAPRCEGTPPSARCWHAAAAIAPPASTAFGMLVFGGVDGYGREQSDCFQLRPLTDVEPPEGAAPADPKGGKGGGKGGGKAAPPPPKGGKGAPPPAETGEPEEDTRPIDFAWDVLPETPYVPVPEPITTFTPAAAPPPGSAVATFALTAVPPMAASAPALGAAPAPSSGSSSGQQLSSTFGGAAGGAAGGGGLRASGSSASLRRASASVAGSTRAVGVGDEVVVIFGPSGVARQGACTPMRRYPKSIVLNDPKLAAKPPPPKLTLKGVKLTRLPPGAIRSAVAAGGASLVVSAAEDDAVISRTRMVVHSSLIPGGSNGPNGEPMLSCDESVTEAGYDGRSHLHLSLVIGGRLVGRLGLGTLLRAESKGSVSRASLVEPHASVAAPGPSDQVGLVQFDWSRVGGPSEPPPLPSLDADGRPIEQLAPTTARGALDAAQYGLGDASDEYRGQFVDGLPHGVGVCNYASGAVYNGQWIGGLRHGQGELKDEHGHVYRGGFANGEQAGLGAWHYADGATYSGPMVGGLRHGRGVYRAADGATYDGEWREGSRNGAGVDTSADKLTTYSGGWKSDLKHGKGKLVQKESLKSERETTFEGEWKEDLRHGHGKLVWPLGDSYVGQWQNDLRNGRGLLRLISGEEYDGKWVGDLRCGEGTCRLPGGELYTGQWSKGGRWGEGTCVYTDGSRYIGQWRGGQRHGVGFFASLDGLDRYEGTWSLDQPHGKGVQQTAEGDVYTGFFHAGERCGRGVLVTQHGDTYDGEWAHGLQDGEGTLVQGDGERYVGKWVAGERCGVGRCEQPSGDVYEGEWARSMKMGFGEMTYALSADPTLGAPGRRAGRRSRASGGAPRVVRGGKGPDAERLPRYSGAWSHDEREGLGRMSFPPPAGAQLARPATATAGRASSAAVPQARTRPGSAVAGLTLSGGEWYEGEWIRGRRHGKGTAVFPNGECYVGDWVEGVRKGVGYLAYRPGQAPVQAQALRSPSKR